MSLVVEQQFQELCKQAASRNSTPQNGFIQCETLAEVVRNLTSQLGSSSSTTTSTTTNPLATNNNITDSTDHKINSTKLVVLTIIIFFTVVGNFGVVLAILLRR